VLSWNHNELSTFGLIDDRPKSALMAWIDQLIDQDVLLRQGEYRTLCVTAKGRNVLKDRQDAVLTEMGKQSRPERSRKKRATAATATTKRKSAAPETKSLTTPAPLDMDARALFEKLRQLRKEIADEHEVPAFMVFSDKTLREIARNQPASETDMLAIKGVGPTKWEAFGRRFIEAIESHETT
jgi:ATP-dependent DNA helicase RecQ